MLHGRSVHRRTLSSFLPSFHESAYSSHSFQLLPQDGPWPCGKPSVGSIMKEIKDTVAVGTASLPPGQRISSMYG